MEKARVRTGAALFGIALAAAACIALALGLSGCSNNENKQFEGDWKLVSIDDHGAGGGMSAEDIASMDKLGIPMILKVNPDGKYTFGIGDKNAYEGSWTVKDGKINFENFMPVGGHIQDGKLVIGDDKPYMTFEKVEKKK